jgi:hypothetical protein
MIWQRIYRSSDHEAGRWAIYRVNVEEAIKREVPYIRLNRHSLVQLGYGVNENDPGYGSHTTSR